MNAPILIIPLWKIGAEMAAPALEPPERRSRDETRHADQVKLTPLAGRLRARVCAELRRRSVEVAERGGQALAGAKQAGVAPHKVSDGVARHG